MGCDNVSSIDSITTSREECDGFPECTSVEASELTAIDGDGRHLLTERNGTAYTDNGEGLSIFITGHSTAKHPRIEVHLGFKFHEDISRTPRVERGEILTNNDHGSFSCVCTLNVGVEEGYPVTRGNIHCADYPGGKMYITFQAFALPDTDQKGLHYTIYEAIGE